MFKPLEVSSSLEIAQVLTDRLSVDLSRNAKRLYTALVAGGLEVGKDRNYAVQVSEITFFAPAEVVALAIGVHASTLYRLLPQLTAAGLVAARGHYCSHNGKTRADGTLWSVRLDLRSNKKARVGYDWLKKSYRSLAADIEQKKTAWEKMRESKGTTKAVSIKLGLILEWSLSSSYKNHVISDSRKNGKVDLAAIFDVRSAKKQHRPDAIQEAARAIAAALNDHASRAYWQKVLWSLTRLKDNGMDYFEQVYLVVSRAKVDVQEGFARRGGALACSRLKELHWYEQEMMRT